MENQTIAKEAIWKSSLFENFNPDNEISVSTTILCQTKNGKEIYTEPLENIFLQMLTDAFWTKYPMTTIDISLDRYSGPYFYENYILHVVSKIYEYVFNKKLVENIDDVYGNILHKRILNMNKYVLEKICTLVDFLEIDFFAFSENNSILLFDTSNKKNLKIQGL